MQTLTICNCSKTYGDNSILDNVELNLNQGEILGLFGRNGSGKSSLLKIIFGTLKADSINIKINDKPLSQKQIIPSQAIGYLPQDSFLPMELKTRDVVSLFFEGEQQNKIFYEPLVATFDNIKVGKLSLGQLRYLELLIIGNLNHSFLLLDEPFSMLEPKYKELVKSFLRKLKETKGIIITDHYYEDVLSLADRSYLLKNGLINQVKDTIDLIRFKYLKDHI